MHIRRNFGSGSQGGTGPEAAGNLGEALEQFRGSGGQSRAKSAQSREEKRTEQKPDRGREGLGEAMEDKEDGGSSLFLSSSDH